jgi:hypothetical protein
LVDITEQIKKMLQHLQVLFVANKYDDNVWASQRACVREPVGECVVRFAAIAKEKKKKRARGGEFVWGKKKSVMRFTDLEMS